MDLVLQLLFWISVWGLTHTYVVYPLMLRWRGRHLPLKITVSEPPEWPMVSILMAAYNEERVLKEKLDNLHQLDYPPDKLHIYVGSDGSSDRTNAILEAYPSNFIGFHPLVFDQRRGKPSVLNDLAETALDRQAAGADHLFLITDANVLLATETLQRLARHFQDPEIVLVDSHMVNVGQEERGISKSESLYISGEVRTKYYEGALWGTMIGPFGGCYLLRSDRFSPIPPKSLVDDFFLAMHALSQGGKAINDLEAICQEAVSHEMDIEFKRKARISAGNFQNLRRFWRLWFPPFGKKLRYAFFSHKVLRWFGPFFLLAILASSLILALRGSDFFAYLCILQLAGYLIVPLLDRILQWAGIHIFWLRNVRYFIRMNMALFMGFFKYLGGIQGGAWEPTKRV